MFKKLLIPIDDSSCSIHAGTVGLELAKRFHADVLVAHVIEDLPKAYSVGDWGEALLEKGEGLLENWRKRGVDQKLTLETKVIKGQDTAESIITSAQDNSCDLIVMGTHGRKGLARIFLGSVAERVTRLAKTPVILIRETTSSNTPNWQRILVALDGSEGSRKALDCADQLAQYMNAELHLLHVIPDLPPPLVDPIGLGGMAAGFSYENILKELEHQASIIMETSGADIKTEKSVFHTARAQHERIASVIINYAKEHHCDLMVMGTHGRTGFDHLLLGSVAQGVAHNAPIPLLLIRQEEKPRDPKK